MVYFIFFLMLRRPPRATRTDTLFPYTTLFRSTADRGRLLPADRMLRLSPVAFGWQQAQGAGQRRHAAPRTQAASALVVSAGHDASDHLFHWHRRISRRDQDQHRLMDDKRSEEHTSELQSLMRISYAVFCLKKKKSHD